MRCLAVCQTELVGRLLHAVLSPRMELELVVESRALARRLHDHGATVTAADPRRLDTYVRADLLPSTAVVVEDAHQRGLKKILEAVRDAGGVLVYLLGTGPEDDVRAEKLRAAFPEVTGITLAELVEPRLGAELDRSLTRQRVQQYQRYFSDADRVLILTHHDPDPDAIASGLALRTRRTGIARYDGTAIGAAIKSRHAALNLPFRA